MNNRMLLAVFVGSLLSTTSAYAQRDLLRDFGRALESQGRQYVRGQIPQSAPQRSNQNQIRRQQIPSEGGGGSGGRDRIFNPGGGGDFILPGSGRPPRRDFNPGGQIIYPGQPNPGGSFPPGGQQVYPGGQPVYPGNTIQPGGVTYPSSNASIPSAPVSTSQFVVIRVPQSASGSIYYRLSSGASNYGFTMSAGQEQRFRVSRDWVISYNDGSKSQKYRLVGGKTYTLKKVDGNRWQLYSIRAAGS